MNASHMEILIKEVDSHWPHEAFFRGILKSGKSIKIWIDFGGINHDVSKEFEGRTVNMLLHSHIFKEDLHSIFVLFNYKGVVMKNYDFSREWKAHLKYLYKLKDQHALKTEDGLLIISNWEDPDLSFVKDGEEINFSPGSNFDLIAWYLME